MYATTYNVTFFLLLCFLASVTAAPHPEADLRPAVVDKAKRFFVSLPSLFNPDYTPPRTTSAGYGVPIGYGACASSTITLNSAASSQSS